MRRIHLKGDVVCTLLLMVALCLLLYAHSSLTPFWESWQLDQGAPSSRSLLGAPAGDSQDSGPPLALLARPSELPRCRQDPEAPARPASQIQAKAKAAAKSKAHGKAKAQGAKAKSKSVVRKVLPTKAATVASGPTLAPFDFEDYLRKKDNRDFRMMIDQPDKCAPGPEGTPPYMLIVIKSVAADFDKRQVVRRTWGREGEIQPGIDVRTVFLLGVPKNATQLPLWDRLLAYESETFKVGANYHLYL